MYVFFSTSWGEASGEAMRVTSALGRRHILINPNSLGRSNVALLQRSGIITLRADGQHFDPKAFVLLTNWRTDCILDFPRGERYPNLQRRRSQQFLQDISYAYADKRWFPASIEKIDRAESKIALLRSAFDAGLSIPKETINSSASPSLLKNEKYFRKNLGYPFTVSLNRRTREEVGVTVTGTLASAKRSDNGRSLWQWQEPIYATSHVRCFVLGNKVWAVKWDYPKNVKITDFRHLNQIEERTFRWEPYTLPPEVGSAIKLLAKRLGLSWCSPEFLIRRSDGDHVFIDMNPCGDWEGFFCEEVCVEICQAIVKCIRKT